MLRLNLIYLGWLTHFLGGVPPEVSSSSSLSSAVSVSGGIVSELYSNSQQSSSEKVLESFSSSIVGLFAAGCGVDMARGSENFYIKKNHIQTFNKNTLYSWTHKSIFHERKLQWFTTHFRSVNLKSIFSWNSINAQNTNEILDKTLPYEARAEFCEIFCSFWGNGVSRKIVFEIYRPIAQVQWVHEPADL